MHSQAGPVVSFDVEQWFSSLTRYHDLLQEWGPPPAPPSQHLWGRGLNVASLTSSQVLGGPHSEISAAIKRQGPSLPLCPHEVLLAGGEGDARSLRASCAQSSCVTSLYTEPAFGAFYNGAQGSRPWIL